MMCFSYFLGFMSHKTFGKRGHLKKKKKENLILDPVGNSIRFPIGGRGKT